MKEYFATIWAKIKTGAYTAATVALVVIGVSQVGFNNKTGEYYLITNIGDTVTFADSTEFVDAADSIYNYYYGLDTSSIAICYNYKGELIDYIDANQNNGETNANYLRNAIPAFRYRIVPRADTAFWRAKINNPDTTFAVDFSDLIVATGENDFVQNFQAKARMLQWDPDFDFKTVIKDIDDCNNPNIPDKLAISSGSATVGSGGTYATFAAAFADIANLTGNLTFFQISNITETGDGTITETLGGYTLKIANISNHYGNENSGYAITWSRNNHLWTISMDGSTAGSMVIVSELKILQPASKGASYNFIRTSSSTNLDIYIRDLLFVGDGYSNGNAIRINDADCDAYIYNVVVDSMGLGVITDVIGTATIENVTVYGCVQGINCNSRAAIVRNCAAISCGTDFLSTTAATGYNNASTDATADDANWATASGNITSITAANEFSSFTRTDSDFLRLTRGASLDTFGTAPTIADNDSSITGYPRPWQAGKYAIGADVLTDTIIRYVNTNVAAGGNGRTQTTDNSDPDRPYATGTAWEAAEDACDLTKTGTVHRAYFSGGNQETAALQVSGWTTSPVYHVEMHQTDRCGSNGEYNTTCYGIDVTDETGLDIREDCHVHNFQIRQTLTSASDGSNLSAVSHSTGGASRVEYENMLLVGVNSGTTAPTSWRGMTDNNTSDTIFVFSSIGRDFLASNGEGDCFLLQNPVCSIYNCLAFNSAMGIRTGSNGEAVNCVSFQNVDDWNSAVVSYSASDDVQAGTGNINPAAWSTVFVDTANNDFRLLSTDTDLRGAGTDAPGGALFSRDFRGFPYVSTWDIGPFSQAAEVASGKITVGTGGQTSNFITGIDTFTNPVSGNCTLEVVGNFTQTREANMSTLNLNGNNFVFTGDAGFTGIPSTTADTITFTDTITAEFLIRIGGFENNVGDTVQVCNLFMVATEDIANGGIANVATKSGNNFTLLVYNNLAKGPGKTAAPDFWPSNADDAEILAWNNVVWAWDNGFSTFRAGDTLENNIAYDSDAGFAIGNNTSYWANNAGFDCNSHDMLVGGTSPIGNNNVSSDLDADDFNTGTNNSISKTAATEFESLDETNLLFLVPVNTGDTVWTGGIAPSIAGDTADIRGNSRPGSDLLYAMGALEPLGCVAIFDTTYRDTTIIDSTCFSDYDSIYVVRVDTIQIDSICAGTTTVSILSRSIDTLYHIAPYGFCVRPRGAWDTLSPTGWDGIKRRGWGR